VVKNGVRRAARSASFALGVFLMLAGIAPAAHAAPVASGDLVVYRVGTGSAALSSASNAVFLDEYTTSGTLVQSIAMPTADTPATGAHALTASGTATSEGELTISPNGQFIAATGYDAVPGTASIAGTSSTTVNRVVAIVNVASGSVDTSTALNAYTGNNPRSAVTTDGTNIWLGGAGAPGVGYTTLGSTSVTQPSTTVTNVRQVNVFNGQLYTSSSSGSTIRLGAVGSGLPTSSGQTITNLPGFETSTGSPYAYFFATLNSGGSSPDTVYVAEDTAGGGQIQKWTLSAGSWSLTGTIAAAGVRGITGVVNGSSVTLYGTTGGSTSTGGGALYAVTDATGYGVAPTASVTTIATAAANEAFRGLALVPSSNGTSVPEAPLVAVLPVTAGLGFVLLSAVKRRRRPAAA
jgi:hypothetical protein